MEVFDPGALLKGLAAYDAFDEILRTDLVREFWTNIKADDPRLVYLLTENPGETQESLSNVVPMFLHGDKVEFANDDSLMVWHMGSVLSTMSSLSSGLLLAATPAKHRSESTMRRGGYLDSCLGEHLGASLYCLAPGTNHGWRANPCSWVEVLDMVALWRP